MFLRQVLHTLCDALRHWAFHKFDHFTVHFQVYDSSLSRTPSVVKRCHQYSGECDDGAAAVAATAAVVCLVTCAAQSHIHTHTYNTHMQGSGSYQNRLLVVNDGRMGSRILWARNSYFLHKWNPLVSWLGQILLQMNRLHGHMGTLIARRGVVLCWILETKQE